MTTKSAAPSFCSPAYGGRTLVLHGKEDLRIEERGAPRDLGEHDVLIAPRSVGICGSDMHYYSEAVIGGKTIPFPQCHSSCFGGVLGHEAAGEVLEVGAKVTCLGKGDRVAIEPGLPCGLCQYCLGGRYNLCDKMRFLGSFLSNYSGALTEKMVHDSRFCFKLPENVSYDEAAMLEPMSVGLAAVRRGQVGMGSRVLVCGAGPVGLMCLVVAKAVGAGKVAITDMSDARLAMAKQFGADEVYNVGSKDAMASMPHDWNVALECTGATPSLNTVLDVVQKGARVVLVGMGKYEVECRKVQQKELDMVGVFRYCNTYAAALGLVASGKVDLKRMVTHHFDLSAAPEAFRTLRSDPSAIKVMIHPTSTPAERKRKRDEE